MKRTRSAGTTGERQVSKSLFSGRLGFTLVELLVVITIIGILVSLLVPAVQAARESMRRAHCKNNLRQLGMACKTHESIQGHLPTGGWGWGWAGDVERGFGVKQPGGWHFNILPYLEQKPLYNLANSSQYSQSAAGKVQVQTPVAAFQCPSRRQEDQCPFTLSDNPFYNADAPEAFGPTDYAASVGGVHSSIDIDASCVAGPATLAEGDGMSSRQWADTYPDTQASGVIFRRSKINLAHILDGASNTYLIGERVLDSLHYSDGLARDNQQGWNVGFDCGVNRWTHQFGDPDDVTTSPSQYISVMSDVDPAGNPASVFLPWRDVNGGTANTSCKKRFGSAHAIGFHVVFCDGSVDVKYYSITPEVHWHHGDRRDNPPDSTGGGGTEITDPEG